VLAEVDALLNHCKNHNVNNETISEINVKTVNYIKKCKRLKSSRNITLTKKYLKDNNLLAVPFDKGIGICVMSKELYNSKLEAILQLSQFEKIVTTRKNAKHIVLKEEERIVNILKYMKQNDRIDEKLFTKLRPMGSQPPRLWTGESPQEQHSSAPCIVYARISIPSSWRKSSRVVIKSTRMWDQFIDQRSM